MKQTATKQQQKPEALISTHYNNKLIIKTDTVR